MDSTTTIDKIDKTEVIREHFERTNGEDYIVRVGVSEDGQNLGLGEAEFAAELEGFRMAAEANGANRVVLDRQQTSGWVLVRRHPESLQDVAEVRVAVVGNVDAGKSTLLGVLTKGVLDDGRGLARLRVFRHKHEIDSGRTSSIGCEILGFDASGQAIHKTEHGDRLTWEEVCARAHRLVTFLDLAGHERYLKTTMFGLTGCSPDYALLMVGANAGLVGMAREHLSVAFALSVPVAVVVTKVDMCPAPVLEETMRQLQKVLRSPACRRAPVVVKTADEALLVSRQLVSQRLCPIFQVSNVTGEGIDRLKLFLNAVPTQSAKYSVTGPVEYEIVETFLVPGVGTVVSGTMISGHLSLGQTVFLGPDGNGQFTQTQIKGIHRKRVVVTEAWAGQSVSFALKRIKRNAITKGMIILTADPNALLPSPTSPASPTSPTVVSRACMEFEAEVIILFHSTTMGPRYQAMLHCGVARQTVVIVAMGQDLLRTGDRALVRFRFLRHPEFLRVGARLVFREGRTKGVGRITRLF